MKRTGPMRRTAFKSTPKRMKQRSGKPKARKSASGPLEDAKHLDNVREGPCCTCGVDGPVDPHHCKDKPPAGNDIYVYCPGYGETSADRDAIPLCRYCHDLYHRHKAEFHARYGKDYEYIAETRERLAYL